MKHIFIALFIILPLLIFAQSDFDAYKKSQENQVNTFKKADITSQANFYNQQDSLFIQYKDKIEDLWNEFIESTPKKWVSYSSDFRGRSQVDFEHNNIKFETIIEKTSQKQPIINEKKAKTLLKKQIVAILKEKNEISKEPILENQVLTPDKKIITSNNVEKVAENLINKAKKISVTTKEGKRIEKFEIKLELIPNNIHVRVKQFRPKIEELCKKYEVDVSLALAIIHTESYFNPKAYNRHGNAYGMMQIVPKYAGLTMNNYIYKKNKQPSARELFNPNINLEMGIGYLRWLADKKWAKVKNRTNRNYCVICSYNGGPGTIYKAMTGKMTNIGDKWEPMFEELSQMKSEKLYQKLRKDIPYKETRNYIKSVKEKMDKYYHF